MKRLSFLLLTLLSCNGMAQTNSTRVAYTVEHKLTARIAFVRDPYFVDRVVVWSRCKGKGTVGVWSMLKFEVIGYDAKGREMDFQGRYIGEGGQRHVVTWQMRKMGINSVEIDDYETLYTYEFNFTYPPAMKTIIRRWSLESYGNDGTTPATNPISEQRVLHIL